ncbi:MAG TPA: type II secretion system F family protein [archaeon]|nr:type II secretion system F family protein [archaeon]
MAEEERKEEKLEALRKKVEEKEKLEKARAPLSGEGEEKRAIDLEKVESIVSRMRKKYAEKGLEVEEKAGGRLGELRGLVAEEKREKITIQGPEELKEFKSPAIKQIGRIYESFGAFLKPLNKALQGLPQVKMLDYYLFSANMRYSGSQWLAISTVVAFIVALIGGIISATYLGAILASAGFPTNLLAAFALLPIIVFIVLFLVVGLIALIIPSSKAKQRGEALNVELPFALRHMGTELRAGIGLYKTLQTIAQADYGVLSEEFARTIAEIEEGTDTRDALRHFASRTQSKAMRNALLHIIRALKTGGNLSDIMNRIAEDVSFELRMRMRDFAEKMNFLGVIFIFSGIVLPVFVAILGAIANAPLGFISQAIPLSVPLLMMFYLLFMPAVLILLMYYLYIAQPKV